MKTITLQQLKENYQIWECAIIVFKQKCFRKKYTRKQRSFRIYSNSNYFNPDILDNSLCCFSLEDIHAFGSMDYVWLDIIMDVTKELEIEHCYISRCKGFKINDKAIVIGNPSNIHCYRINEKVNILRLSLDGAECMNELGFIQNIPYELLVKNEDVTLECV